MKNVNINGVNGVFLSYTEFNYIKWVIKNNNLLLVILLKGVHKIRWQYFWLSPKFRLKKFSFSYIAFQYCMLIQ